MPDQSYINFIDYFEEYSLLVRDVEISQIPDKLNISAFAVQFWDNTFLQTVAKCLPEYTYAYKGGVFLHGKGHVKIKSNLVISWSFLGPAITC